MKFPFFPPEASTLARQVDILYLVLCLLCGAIILGIFAVMIFFLFRYRRGRRAHRRRLAISTTPFELTWTVIPLALFMGLFTWGAVVYNRQQTNPPGSLEINVIGKQWMWKIQHPSGQREINELHVPVGRPVKLIMASQDVIHSFYIPAFRIKQDVVPGRYTTEWFQATRPGQYHIFCAEYCGKDHSRMRGTVYVLPPAEYEHWLVRGSPDASLAEAGARLFRALGCSGCHSGGSVVPAPLLQGVYGRPVALQSGAVVRADEAYLRDSILQPARDVTAGYNPVMPSFQGQISEEQLFELIAYLKSLGGDGTEGQP